VKAIYFSYLMPADAFPLAFTIARGPEQLEVLLEDQAAVATAPDLIETAPLVDRDKLYRRFQATDFIDNGVLTIEVPTEAPLSSSTLIVIVVFIVVTGMSVALVFALRRGARLRVLGQNDLGTPSGARINDMNDVTSLAKRIADLDESFSALQSTSQSELKQYRQTRDALKRRLTELLAKEKGKA